ncbi:MAG: EF-P beta-lysylation protein EpmB [Planctomycetota bacterium]|nr:EF-P beta-lysylation protein EpmB [Planctomycetota bacterium]MCX8039252.1 EF-P beta-lysylation protein EpmB [Planctomycetota bacterium]
MAAADADARAATWQRVLAEAITDPAELWRVLALDPALLPSALSATRAFALRVPRGFVALMERGNPRDPLLLQVLPQAAELLAVSGFSADPLAEADCQAAPGLLTKYRGRALLVVHGACAVHCRYCFRRHYPYESLPRGPRWWAAALAAIAADPDCHELILSGGDPLLVPDAQLAELIADAAAIAHLARLRVHTRLPVVLPERIGEELCRLLARSRLRCVVVLHANHPRELSPAVAAACARLRAAGCLLLNQSVLLAGVNDDPAVLAALSERLAELGVVPYYLHALDRVAGAAHFLVDDARARAIHRELSAMLPGWLVPRLVREVPGAASKLPL